MNILILTNHLNIGGITRYVLNLAAGLKENGHNVFVGASARGQRQNILEKKNISFLELPLETKSILSPRLMLAYAVLKKFIQDNDIHIIHAQTRITQFLGFLLSRSLDVRYVCTFHGFYRPHLVRKLLPCFGNLTIAISQAVGSHLIEDFGLNRDNLRVVYNAVVCEFDSQVDDRADYSKYKGKPTLGIIARLSAEKGHEVLFSAFERLINGYPSARLLVVGQGKKELELKHWVKTHGLNRQIIFLGNEPNLSSIYNILDISVLPSSREGLGFSILEAQAKGLPVVASRVGGIEEIIEHKHTGILVEPNNAQELYQGIKLLLEDSALRQKIKNNAKKQIEDKFGLKDMSLKVEAIYKQALKRG